MIIKQKTNSFKVMGLEALLRRLPENHPRFSDVENDLRKTRAGENGERILSNVFQKYKFPYEHYILHDLNLQSTGKFQIDTLFLCNQGAVIFEMKNIAGRISFPEEQNQLTRTLENGQVDSFECPSIQLERHKMLLEDWFYERDVAMPIFQAAVFPRPQQQFEKLRKDLKILFPLEIPVYLRKISSFHPRVELMPLKDIAVKLKKSHRDYNPFPLTKAYSVNPSDLITGVRCQKCGRHGMLSVYNGWGCNKCGHINRHGHIESLFEYFTLINPRISNKVARDFLHIDCAQKTTRLLRKLGLPFEGTNKGRLYVTDINVLASLHSKFKETNESKVTKC